MKEDLKAKEELWKLKYFTMKNLSSKNPLRETKIPYSIMNLNTIISLPTKANKCVFEATFFFWSSHHSHK
jgi:hypothetical protein